VEPDWPDERLPLVTLVAGMAAHAVLGSELRLKWPNDIVTIPGDKVAGLLTERTDDLVVIGLGVNLYWPDAPPGMAAVHESDPGPGAGRLLAGQWAASVLTGIVAGPGAWDPAAYASVCATVGSVVTWEGGGPATAVGIDPNGGLIVDDGAVRTVLRSGGVQQIRTTTLPDWTGNTEEARWHC
jgi:biotin-(acetyl-CoA carboxylase) ligase